MSPARAPASTPAGFEVLDGCHRQTLEALDTLSTLLLHLESGTLEPTGRERETTEKHTNGS